MIAAVEDIILIAAVQGIGAIAAIEGIIAVAAQKLIGIGIADQAIMTMPAAGADCGTAWRQDQKLDFRGQGEVKRGDDGVIA